jgi:hypothetical protein
MARSMASIAVGVRGGRGPSRSTGAAIGVAGDVEFVQRRWDAVGACGFDIADGAGQRRRGSQSWPFPSARTWMLTPWRLCLPE